MGYYVRTTYSTVKFDRKYLSVIDDRFTALSKHEEIMNGGASNGEKWFSWMNEWEPNKHTVADVFTHLGFTVEEDGMWIKLGGYDSKLGQEDVFFEVIKDVLVGRMKWLGENGRQTLWNFNEEHPIVLSISEKMVAEQIRKDIPLYVN